MAIITFAGSTIYDSRNGVFTFTRGTREQKRELTDVLGGGTLIQTFCAGTATHTMRIHYHATNGTTNGTIWSALENLYDNQTVGTLDLSAYGLGTYTNCVIKTLNYDQSTMTKIPNFYAGGTSLNANGFGNSVIANLEFLQL